VWPHVAVHNIHSLFGNQNAIASGLARTLKSRFPNQRKDVIVLAGDGATVDIGLDMTMQSWFRQERFTTICFDNELYANTGGQESGLMQKGFVAKMAPKGKKFDKVRLLEIAREAGCHYATMLTVSKPNRVEEAIRNAVEIAWEVGPTFVQLYTPCILEIGKQSMEGLDEMKKSEKIGERFVAKSYITDEGQAVIDRLKSEKKERKLAFKQKMKEDQQAREARVTREKELVPA
jgi:pyruvate ferredoxin oxidoreductase beta subunit